MNLKPLSIDLDAQEVRQVLSIALDENEAEALDFIRNVMAKRVEKALQSH